MDINSNHHSNEASLQKSALIQAKSRFAFRHVARNRWLRIMVYSMRRNDVMRGISLEELIL